MKYKQIALLLSLLITLVIFSSFNKKDEWNLYQQSKGIQVYYKLTDCDDEENGLFQKFIIFKLVNTTDFDVTVKWTNQLWYNEKCTTCNGTNEDNAVEITLKAHKEIVGDYKNKNLSIFSEFKNHPDVDKLTNFELKDLTIKPILR